VVVIAGYQGVSYRKEVTTLGRGGSDTTAVAMAAALGAEWCEICSDVDGVYSADPKIVKDAERIPVLSYEETQELAESGARVLNAQAVEFAKEKGIAIYARSNTSPLPANDPSNDGTVVRKHSPRLPGSVIGVASEKEVLMIQSHDINRLLCLMDEAGVPGKQLHFFAAEDGQKLVTLVVSKENLHQEAEFRTAINDIGHWDDTLAAVSIIGAGINASNVQTLRGAHTLQAAGIGIANIATSSFRTTWLIDRAKVEKATRLLHRLFLEETATRVS
jgi:aspartate kinase